MPHITTDDGINLAYEESGSGTPVLFVHEFAGDMTSWEPQLRTFGMRYRAIAYNARGYPPSDVPPTPASYSQDRARLDILAMLDKLGIEKAHIVGLSMGGFAALHFGIHHSDRALSLTVAGCGYGAEPDKRAQFKAEANATADLIQNEGIEAFANTYSLGPTRVQFQNKNLRGWEEFRGQLATHSALGSANTMRGVQAERPSLFDLKDAMAGITAPTLVLTGDEDWPCLLPGVMMKENIPSAALVVMANCGHTINIEDPDRFNAVILDFVAQVDSGRWPNRDPRAMSQSILGVKK